MIEYVNRYERGATVRLYTEDEMASFRAELDRVRAQRDKFVRAWYSEADGDSDADKERWLAAEGLRIINRKVEEIEGA